MKLDHLGTTIVVKQNRTKYIESLFSTESRKRESGFGNKLGLILEFLKKVD